MARQAVFLALLLLFAVVGLASATPTATTPAHPSSDAAAAPSGDDATVGNIDGDSEAAPVGGPVPDGVFTPITTTAASAPAPSGATAGHEVSSAVAGVAAAVAAVFF